MARTALSDVWVPSVFESYQIEDSVEKTAFVDSGVAVTNQMFNDLANGAGRITTMPYWNALDASNEPNYSNDVYTDIAEPDAVTAEEMIARIVDLNNGWGAMDLVSAIAGSDPMKLVAAQVDKYWNQQFQRRVIATAVGIYNDNVATGGSDMVFDISDALAAVDDANRISGEAIISATLTLGDNLDWIGTIAMHSIVYGKLLKSNLIDFIPDSDGRSKLATYLGKRIVVDDGMPIVGGNGTTVSYKYLCILFAPGAIGYGRGNAKVPMEFDREPARGNGGGVETLWVRKRWVVHPHGYSFNSSTITGPGLSPTWADLRLATNWDRVADRKNIGISFLVVNA